MRRTRPARTGKSRGSSCNQTCSCPLTRPCSCRPAHTRCCSRHNGLVLSDTGDRRTLYSLNQPRRCIPRMTDGTHGTHAGCPSTCLRRKRSCTSFPSRHWRIRARTRAPWSTASRPGPHTRPRTLQRNTGGGQSQSGETERGGGDKDSSRVMPDSGETEMGAPSTKGHCSTGELTGVAWQTRAVGTDKGVLRALRDAVHPQLDVDTCAALGWCGPHAIARAFLVARMARSRNRGVAGVCVDGARCDAHSRGCQRVIPVVLTAMCAAVRQRAGTATIPATLAVACLAHAPVKVLQARAARARRRPWAGAHHARRVARATDRVTVGIFRCRARVGTHSALLDIRASRQRRSGR